MLALRRALQHEKTLKEFIHSLNIQYNTCDVRNNAIMHNLSNYKIFIYFHQHKAFKWDKNPYGIYTLTKLNKKDSNYTCDAKV